jgi:hypothetical protein
VTDPMDDQLLRLYLDEAKDECERAFASVEALNAALRSRVDPFDAAEMLVHHAAAISRIFWPGRSISKEAQARADARGDALCKALGLAESHRVRSRHLRDHFEHFDERLDTWAEESKYRNIVRKLVGPRAAVAGEAIADGDIIRHFDPSTNVYAFRGKRFDIQALVDGLRDMHARIVARLAQPRVRSAPPQA